MRHRGDRYEHDALDLLDRIKGTLDEENAKYVEKDH